MAKCLRENDGLFTQKAEQWGAYSKDLQMWSSSLKALKMYLEYRVLIAGGVVAMPGFLEDFFPEVLQHMDKEDDRKILFSSYS